MVLRNCDLESIGAGVGCISGNDKGLGWSSFQTRAVNDRYAEMGIAP